MEFQKVNEAFTLFHDRCLRHHFYHKKSYLKNVLFNEVLRTTSWQHESFEKTDISFRFYEKTANNKMTSTEKDYEILGEDIKIPIRNRDGVIKDFTYISSWKESKIVGKKFHFQDGYAAASFLNEDGKYVTMRLHRLLVEVSDDMKVDHEDGDRLNNRDKNLRITDDAGNAQNIHKRKQTESGFLGVNRIAGCKERPWRAMFSKQFLGYFRTKEEAAFTVDEHRRSLFGANARVNGVPRPVDYEPYVKRQKRLPPEIESLPEGITSSIVKGIERFAVGTQWQGHYWKKTCATLSEALKILEEFENEKQKIKESTQIAALQEPILRDKQKIALLPCKASGKRVYIRVDDDTYLLYRGCKIFVHKETGYPMLVFNGKLQYLHRLVMGAKKGQKIDHRNRKKLDARRKNLRVATSSLNGHNISVRKAKVEAGVPYIGVCRRKNMFEARISKEGKNYHCGTYATMEVAAFARDAKAKQLFGEDANLNDVEVEDYEFDYTIDRAVLKVKR
jgi:hypothetical protein